jgi:ligand-binding SRPBCC domain-containing protein
VPTAAFTHSFRVAAPVAVVAEHLAAAESYVGLSPLVIAVRDVRVEGGVTLYTAVERVPLGPLHWDNLIRVSLGSWDEGSTTVVGGHVDRPGRVTLDDRYELTADAGGCVIVDAIVLEAPLGLTRFAARKAREVQLARARVLAERLEG